MGIAVSTPSTQKVSSWLYLYYLFDFMPFLTSFSGKWQQKGVFFSSSSSC